MHLSGFVTNTYFPWVMSTIDRRAPIIHRMTNDSWCSVTEKKKPVAENRRNIYSLYSLDTNHVKAPFGLTQFASSDDVNKEKCRRLKIGGHEWEIFYFECNSGPCTRCEHAGFRVDTLSTRGAFSLKLSTC